MTHTSIIKSLQPFVSEHKQELIEKVLSKRTRHFTLVFEDIDKPHNISAVLRTAECLGIQDLHFIKNRNDYKINPDITQGAAKWLTLHHHNERTGAENIADAFKKLRSTGYKIYATSLRDGAIKIGDIDTNDKTAIVFGTEADGISDQVASSVDGLVQIPMMGFTESFNLSVSAAIILNDFLSGSNGDGLSTEEKEELRAEWYKKIVRESDKILERLLGEA